MNGLSTGAREIRCPTKHPKFRGECGKLLARYDPGIAGRLELDCRRCGERTVLEFRSTSSARCGSTGATV